MKYQKSDVDGIIKFQDFIWGSTLLNWMCFKCIRHAFQFWSTVSNDIKVQEAIENLIEQSLKTLLNEYDVNSSERSHLPGRRALSFLICIHFMIRLDQIETNSWQLLQMSKLYILWSWLYWKFFWSEADFDYEFWEDDHVMAKKENIFHPVYDQWEMIRLIFLKFFEMILRILREVGWGNHGCKSKSPRRMSSGPSKMKH